MTPLAALVLDRLRLAWRGGAIASGAAAAGIATCVAAFLPGIGPAERAASAIAALSGIATVLGGLVVAGAGASRVAHERATRRLAVERASAASRADAVVSEMAHVVAAAAAVALVAALGAGVAGGRDPEARPRPAVRPEGTAGGATTLAFRSPFGSLDSRLAFVPVVRRVPPDVPPRVAEVDVRFAASGRTVRVRVPNETFARVGIEPGDADSLGRIVAEAAPVGGGIRLRIEAGRLEGPPGSIAWNALAFGIGIGARLSVLGAAAILVGSLARPALAAAFVAALLAFGLFGGAAAQYARELEAASRHGHGSGLPWGAISGLASILHAAVPDLSLLSTASEWVAGEVIPPVAVGRVALRAGLLCGGLCAICIALFRRREVLSSA